MPSLIRLSPSTTETIWRGTAIRRMIVVAATGSVGATMAPSVKAAAHGISGTSALITTATAHIVISTSPTACSVIGRRLRRRSCRLAKKAAE